LKTNLEELITEISEKLDRESRDIQTRVDTNYHFMYIFGLL